MRVDNTALMAWLKEDEVGSAIIDAVEERHNRIKELEAALDHHIWELKMFARQMHKATACSPKGISSKAANWSGQLSQVLKSSVSETGEGK